MARDEYDDLVDAIAVQMKERLRARKKEGWCGWKRDWFDEDEIRKRLYNQSRRKQLDPVDIANYAAFLFYKQHRHRTPAPSTHKGSGEG